jgi:Flp pilus assembly protein TadG
MMSWLRTLLGDRRGAAAAEMALMLPFLLTLLFVTFEGGYFLWNEHKVVKGVRDGARYAARLPFSRYAGCPVAPDAPAAVTDPTLTAIRQVTRTGKLSGGTPTLGGWLDTHITVTCDQVAGAGGLFDANAGRAPRVNVSAAVPYPPSPITALAGVLGFDADGITLRASAHSSVMGL